MKEWKINEKLPQSFVHLVNETLKDKCYQHKATFIKVAGEWGVNPANLSRWIAGFGPLTKEDIAKLASILGPAIYITLGLIRPE